MVARHPAVAEGASDIDFPSTERWSETTMKHVDHKVNPVTGVEYDKYTDGEAVEVIGTTPNGENFHHYFPRDGSQHGTDSKGNEWEVPSKRER